ncbi:hypothetical protein J5I95_19425 [Candidatus Poribacteria bacterium]|nr:hypothetical protein [Candidatus Poribacteria bacterium]
MFDNNSAWRDAFDDIFGSLDIRECTPLAILDTIKTMPRASNRLDDIVIAARSRNIAANDDDVLSCLRTLYRDGKIGFREIAGRQFFITQ